jgi:hypothetical protein
MVANLERLSVVVEGENLPDTRSDIVDTVAVTKGMVLTRGAGGKGYCQPADADAEIILGIAMSDASIGEYVTYALPPFTARGIVAESQTVVVDNKLAVGKSTISGTGYLGQLKVLAEPTDAASIINYMQRKVGTALESKTTGADGTAVIKFRFEGNI